MALSYRDAGVDIEEGDALVERLKPHARRTMRPEVLAGIGGFGGLFEIPRRYQEPVLVAGTDGVGTKLKIAFQSGRHETVGIDLVAMSANDVAVCGAEPLVFLDYFATSRLRAQEAEKVVAGIAEGCVRAGCALIGGETAELPGFYAEGEYDLAGFCVGVVEKSRILDGSRVRADDAVLGIASTGLHSNGFSLARKVLLEHAKLPLSGSLLDELLAPTAIYAKECLELREAFDVHAFAHITGGGLPGNLPRVLPPGHRAVVSTSAWPRPEIFGRIQELGQVDEQEMLRTFNCGIGLCAVVRRDDVEGARGLLARRGLRSWEIGFVEEQVRSVASRGGQRPEHTAEQVPGLAEPEVVFRA